MLKESLLDWGGLSGFITQWHVCGPFEAGLQPNPSPNLFDQKYSTLWTEDHLSPWGGCQSSQLYEQMDGVSEGIPWRWEFAQPLFYPELKLQELREYYPSWEVLLQDVDTNRWSKLYYALAVIDSPEDVPVRMHFCGWDGCRLWVNGEFLFEEHSYHKSIYEKESVSFVLKKGLNQILFQLDRDGLVARLEAEDAHFNLYRLQAAVLREKPAKRKVSTFMQLHQIAARVPVTQRYTKEKFQNIQNWKAKMLQHYHNCLGDIAQPDCSYGDARLVATQEHDLYRQEEYVITAEADTEFPCIILKPKAEYFNGIALVLPHGHDTDYRFLTGNVAPQRPRMWVGEYRNNYARRMAEKGFMVATYCERCFMVRKDHFHHTDACNKAQMMSAAMGMQLPRLHIADAHLVHQLLADQKGVDRNKIGISGLSGGGSLAYLVGAYDEKFKAVAAFCCVCSYRDYAYGEGCGMQIVNGWFPQGDMGDLLGLIAPRPLLIGQGLLDTTFNFVRVKEMFAVTQKYYHEMQLPEMAELALYPLAHEYEPDVAEKFFKQHLG